MSISVIEGFTMQFVQLRTPSIVKVPFERYLFIEVV